ncbi:MAG: hypothetical protein QXV18_03110 [Candidatus Nitrosocaldus sp.]
MRQEFITVNNYRVRLLEDGVSSSKHIIMGHPVQSISYSFMV